MDLLEQLRELRDVLIPSLAGNPQRITDLEIRVNALEIQIADLEARVTILENQP